MVLRLDFYVGERDLYGVGFSDNVVFRAQYYIRALLGEPLAMYRHSDERFAKAGFNPGAADRMTKVPGGWQFDVSGDNFRATLQIEIDKVPEVGKPVAVA